MNTCHGNVNGKEEIVCFVSFYYSEDRQSLTYAFNALKWSDYEFSNI